MADSKEREASNGDMLSERELYHYTFLHMFQYGYLSEASDFFHIKGSRIKLFRHFGMDYFTQGGGDKQWKTNLKELDLWTNKESLAAFLMGEVYATKQGAKLREQMLPRMRELGAWMAIYDALGFRSTNEERSLKLLRQYADIVDFTYIFKTSKNPKDLRGPLKPRAESLVSYAIQAGNSDFVGAVLDLHRDEIPLDEYAALAEKLGRWKIFQQVQLARIGSKAFKKVENEKQRIERINAFVHSFLEDEGVMGDDAKKDGEFFDHMVTKACASIKNFRPMCDEVLLMAWRHCVRKYEDPLDSPLWAALHEVCSQILTIPLDKVRWEWFSLYLLSSALWQEKITRRGETCMMYEELVKIVQKQWTVSKDYLKKHISAIEDTDEWKEVLDIPEKHPEDPKEMRQDTYLEPLFQEQELRQMSLSCHTDMVDYYDMRGYLSEMVIRAHELDHFFHESLREILQVDLVSQTNAEGTVRYSSGPIKGEERCQIKAQSEYAKTSVPTVANIADMIRGSAVFVNCAEMVKGFNALVQAIRTGRYPVRKILRIKNSLMRNEKKRRAEGVYRYGDIKMNLLVTWQDKSIVCELQLMTDFILQAKEMDHELYEIARIRKFVESVQRSLVLAADKHQALVMAAIEGDTHKMVRLFVNYRLDELRPLELDEGENGYSPIHMVCATGNLKGFMLILKNLSEDQVRQAVDLRATNGDSPLVVTARNCHKNGHFQILRLLLTEFRSMIDVNVQNKKQISAMHEAARNGRVLALRILLADKGANPNLRDEDGWSPLMTAVKHDQAGSAEVLFQDEKVDTMLGMKSGSTPFMIACFNGYTDIVRAMLATGRAKVTHARPDGVTAYHFAVQNGHSSILELLLARPEIEDTVRERARGRGLRYGPHANVRRTVVKFERKLGI